MRIFAWRKHSTWNREHFFWLSNQWHNVNILKQWKLLSVATFWWGKTILSTVVQWKTFKQRIDCFKIIFTGIRCEMSWAAFEFSRRGTPDTQLSPSLVFEFVILEPKPPTAILSVSAILSLQLSWEVFCFVKEANYKMTVVEFKWAILKIECIRNYW